MTKQDAEARVAKGAALLDEQRPGWAARITIGMLDMASLAHCIIGQECGHFFDWTLVVPIRCQPSEFGFDVCRKDRTGEETSGAAFRLLQDAWIAAIANRLVSASAPVEGRVDGRLQESQP